MTELLGVPLAVAVALELAVALTLALAVEVGETSADSDGSAEAEAEAEADAEAEGLEAAGEQTKPELGEAPVKGQKPGHCTEVMTPDPGLSGGPPWHCVNVWQHAQPRLHAATAAV